MHRHSEDSMGLCGKGEKVNFGICNVLQRFMCEGLVPKAAVSRDEALGSDRFRRALTSSVVIIWMDCLEVVGAVGTWGTCEEAGCWRPGLGDCTLALPLLLPTISLCFLIAMPLDVMLPLLKP